MDHISEFVDARQKTWCIHCGTMLARVGEPVPLPSSQVKNKYTAIDLFSGCGDLTLGLKLAGFKVLAAVENDAFAVETYKANHPEVVVCHDDIRKVKAASLRKRLRLEVGELDFLAGCPPCNYRVITVTVH